MGNLYLIRGLPGSGKSTLARKLCPEHAYANDDFFERHGGYDWNPKQVGIAANYCLGNVSKAMGSGMDVAVANTFTRKFEAKKYFALAEEKGYSIQVIHCQSNFGSIHNVPQASIDAMRDRWVENIEY